MTIWTPALAADKPADIALADAIARDRAAGALRPGTKLPPHRTLAHALGLTVGTITRGYAEATRRGLVRGEVGRGTFVIDSALEPPSDSLFVRRGALGDDILNLTITRPVLGGLTAPLRAALAALAAGDIASFVDYGPPEGLPAHRTAIADWLRRRDAPVGPEQIAIASGAQNALALAAAGLLRPGDAVAVDPLTYPGFKTAAGLFGLNLVAVAGDGAGMDPAALAEAARTPGVTAVSLRPNLPNATRTRMPAERRQRRAQGRRQPAEHGAGDGEVQNVV
ncbi:MAG: aminotransferase class I/II-fold pyridoxal phosphate-dependent enzyme, partial [Alphaproteobacteria bacterium]